MRLEFDVCTCYWTTHPPSQLAAIPGGVSAGRSQQPSSDRAGQRSAGARCTRPPPPPPVPLCHESALNPGRELSGRRVPGRRVAGLLADCSREYPGFCFHLQRRISKSSAPTDLSPEWCSAGSSRGSQGFESPLQCHLETCSSLGDGDGRVSRCLPEELCFQRAACVYRGLWFTPHLRRLLRGRKAPVVDMEEALKMWAGTRPLQSSYPPPPLRSRYLIPPNPGHVDYPRYCGSLVR